MFSSEKVFTAHRTHLGLVKQAPIDRQVFKKTSASDRLVELPQVGGLHHKYRADLVLLKENPLVDIRNTQTIEAVIANGKYFRRDE